MITTSNDTENNPSDKRTENLPLLSASQSVHLVIWLLVVKPLLHSHSLVWAKAGTCLQKQQQQNTSW